MDKDTILTSPKGKATEKYIKKHYPEEYNKIIDYPGGIFSEKLYNYFYNSPKHLCPVCGKSTKFRNIIYGYSEYCSVNCSYKDNNRVLKIKETCKERYGVENPSQSKEIQEKKKDTCLKNHGVDCGLKLKDKIKETCKERYGVENPSQSKEIQEKKKDTYRRKFLKTHELHIGYNEDGEWICKCPNHNCNQCQEKTFIIPQQIFNDRKRLGSELCTKLLPIGHYNQNTSIELFVKNILDEYNINYCTNVRGIIDRKELDIYIPSKNIAIECNGVYWHSLKPSSYHKDKYLACLDKGIQLINVWEDWVRNKPEIVRSLIINKLGLCQERIYARSCYLKHISSKDCNIFLENNHIQGRSSGSVHLGLYYNEELVSIMLFGKSRVGIGKNEDGWELVRFCNKTNTIVVGGASKLFKYFLQEYKPTKIVSYSSNDISNGSIYNLLGFTKSNTYNTSYWYIDKNNMNRYHRYKFRKSGLKKMGFDVDGKTEAEIMRELPYYKIFDAGTLRWEKKI